MTHTLTHTHTNGDFSSRVFAFMRTDGTHTYNVCDTHTGFQYATAVTLDAVRAFFGGIEAFTPADITRTYVYVHDVCGHAYMTAQDAKRTLAMPAYNALCLYYRDLQSSLASEAQAKQNAREAIASACRTYACTPSQVYAMRKHSLYMRDDARYIAAEKAHIAHKPENLNYL